MWRGADRPTDRQQWPLYISLRLCLTRNVTITIKHLNNITLSRALCLHSQDGTRTAVFTNFNNIFIFTTFSHLILMDYS